MAPKKTSTKKVSKKSMAVEVEDMVPRLTETEVLTVKNYMLEVALAEAHGSIVSKDRAAYLKQIDPNDKMGAFQKLEDEANGEKYEALTKYHQFLAEVGKKFNLDISKYSLNDESGVLVPIE